MQSISHPLPVYPLLWETFVFSTYKSICLGRGCSTLHDGSDGLICNPMRKFH